MMSESAVSYPYCIPLEGPALTRPTSMGGLHVYKFDVHRIWYPRNDEVHLGREFAARRPVLRLPLYRWLRANAGKFRVTLVFEPYENQDPTLYRRSPYYVPHPQRMATARLTPALWFHSQDDAALCRLFWC